MTEDLRSQENLNSQTVIGSPERGSQRTWVRFGEDVALCLGAMVIGATIGMGGAEFLASPLPDFQIPHGIPLQLGLLGGAITGAAFYFAARFGLPRRGELI